ncbi:hypothetical protein HOH51_03030, partial [bacterium]|nr:hypothetical protein [bacterium]
MSKKKSIVKAFKNLNKSHMKLSFAYKALVGVIVFLVILGLFSSRTVLEPPSLKIGDNLKGSLQLAGRTLETFTASDLNRIESNTVICKEKAGNNHVFLVDQVMSVREVLLTNLKSATSQTGYIFVTIEPETQEDAFGRPTIPDSHRYFKASEFFKSEVDSGAIAQVISPEYLLKPGQVLLTIFSEKITACSVNPKHANQIRINNSGFTIAYLEGDILLTAERSDGQSYDDLSIKNIWLTDLFTSKEVLASSDLNLSPNFYWIYTDYTLSIEDIDDLRDSDVDLDQVLNTDDLCDGIDDAGALDDRGLTKIGADVDRVGCSLAQAGADLDADGVRDVVDSDIDGEDVANAEDVSPLDPDEKLDTDGDTFFDDVDNCPSDANEDQADLDEDDIGDVCDDEDNRDTDGDGVQNHADNCPEIPNNDQLDTDSDGLGDTCDDEDNRDTDDDGIQNHEDNCPSDANNDQADLDADDIGDVCDDEDNRDTDGDGIENHADNCDDTSGEPDEHGCCETEIKRILNNEVPVVSMNFESFLDIEFDPAHTPSTSFLDYTMDRPFSVACGSVGYGVNGFTYYGVLPGSYGNFCQPDGPMSLLI